MQARRFPWRGGTQSETESEEKDGYAWTSLSLHPSVSKSSIESSCLVPNMHRPKFKNFEINSLIGLE